MKILSVTFDRSAFHGDNFDKLVKSKLRVLSKYKRLLVYHTPTFLEETISLYQTKRSILEKQVHFLFNICNAKWFKRRSELWIDELVSQYPEKKKCYISEMDRKRIEENIQYYLLRDKFDPKALSTVMSEKQNEYKKSLAHKELYIEIRELFASDFAEDRKKGLNQHIYFNIYLADHFDIMGEHLIKKHLEIITDKSIIYNKWIHNKSDYPYFTKYVEGSIYSLFFPFAEPNMKLDKNAMTDIELISFLKNIDILVSNDQKFMKKAFEQLYHDMGKLYLSTDEFIEYMDDNFR
ncbi:MAG: hypothetical protein JW956_10915 [Calditrichaceae bacterium]|nr:hypothetical protein [Calditrichaceae bacterium]